MINTREFIIQYDNGRLDLFEHSKEHKIIQHKKQTYAVDIVDFIKNISEASYVHIEDCPIYHLIHRDLNELYIGNGLCLDAEYWHRHRWRKKLPPMKYIAYWELVRVPRLDDLENDKFDLDNYL